MEVGAVTRRSRQLRLAYSAPGPCRVALNLHDFPGMRAVLIARDPAGQAGSGTVRTLPHGSDEQGRVVLDLPPGEWIVEVRLERTPSRRLGDGLAMAGLALLPAGLLAIRLRRRRRGAPIRE
jgi:hypothetical protein